MIAFSFILNGCQSSSKQVTKIEKVMDKATELEKEFSTTQLELLETRENARLLYYDLINLTISDKDLLHQKIEDGKTYVTKQQQLLDQAEESFNKAYNTSSKIEKSIKKMKDDAQKNEATKLLTVMKERKILMDTFFKDYHETLQLQKTFYQQLEDEKIDIGSLNQQILEINMRTQEMGKIIEEFNQYTRQYIEAEQDFYRASESDEPNYDA